MRGKILLAAAVAAVAGCADLGESTSSYDFTDEVRATFAPFSRCMLRTLEDARYAPLQIGKEKIAHYQIERGLVIYQHDLHLEYFRVTLTESTAGTSVRAALWPHYSGIAGRRVSGIIKDAIRSCSAASPQA